MRFPLYLLLLGMLTASHAQPRKTQKIKPKKEFIDELMAKMTPEQKIYQMVQFTSDGSVTGPKVGENFITWIKQGKVGSVLNATGAAATREIQRINLENSPHKIPILFGHDVIHGYKTIFPINLGMAASFDDKAVENAARIAATEAASGGVHWTFAPMVDISRDGRWSRISEGSGEDPYLVSRMAMANVKGFQGNDLMSTSTLAACAKHFAAYGAAEAGRDYNTTDMSDRTLFDVYLPPFKAALDAGVKTFMASFNEIGGVPATGSKYLMRDILKGRWKFDGFVVSDYTGVNEMVPHGFAKDDADAARLALIAGIDMDMVGASYMKFQKQNLDEGKVTMEQINDGCRRVLELKYDLGLFEDPYRYSDEKREQQTIYKPEYLDAALEMANKSMVLLKNKQQVLPLKKSQKVAFVGPLVQDEYNIIGSWAALGDRYGYAVSVREGIDKFLGTGQATFARGVDFDKPLDDEAQALQNARNADVIVAVMGERENQTGEAASQTNIDLPAAQKSFLEKLKATGKPVVLVLMSGRPNTLVWEDQNLDAILHAWYPGTRGGDAIAQTLYGVNNPAGKLPVTFPRNVGQIPLYYNHKNTGRPYLGPQDPEQKYKSRYTDSDIAPLYPFGYGLSYTNFAYDGLRLSAQKIKFNQPLTISVTVTNTGNFDGTEVVQLYVRDLVGSVTRPVKELKGYERVFLRKGESKQVSFTISSSDLKFHDINMNQTAEAGEFDVFVGTSSATELKERFELVN